MNVTHVSAIRQAAPGSPSMREVARRMDVSQELVRRFESGQQALSAEKRRLYAKTIGASDALVERMFLLEAQRYHRRQLAEVTQLLRGMPGKAVRLPAAV